MFAAKIKLPALLVVFFLIGLPFQSLTASSTDQAIPPDFSLVISDIGTELYRKDYKNGNPDFVQVVDLSRGAAIQLLHGDIVDPRIGNGFYGGDDPLFERQRLREIWNGFSVANPSAFCVTNGQFFSPKPDPTNLAFPLKKDGEIVSDGYGRDGNGIEGFPGQKLILEIWDDKVDIVPLTEESLYSSSAPNIIAGLTEDAVKPPKTTARTFIGIDDNDNNGEYEVVLIFNSKTSTQPDAANILRDFGADKVIMFDGGSSTQLICRGTDYVTSSSEIPQSLGVISKIPPPLVATVVSQPNWPVLVEGEDLQVEVEIMNTGSETWDSNRFTFVNTKEPWGANEVFSLPKDVKRGETITFTWTTEQFTKWGVYTTEWHMAKDGESFIDPVKFSVIVLPKQLEEKRKELEEKIKEWAEEQVENIEERVAKWIQEQIDKKINEKCNPAAGLLPIIMLIAFSKVRKPK